jgi:hypothetical protein
VTTTIGLLSVVGGLATLWVMLLTWRTRREVKNLRTKLAWLDEQVERARLQVNSSDRHEALAGLQMLRAHGSASELPFILRARDALGADPIAMRQLEATIDEVGERAVRASEAGSAPEHGEPRPRPGRTSSGTSS